MRAKDFIPASKPRNFVAKNQKTAGAGAHKDKKKAEKQGDVKHKQKQFEQGVAEGLTEMDKSQTPPGRDGVPRPGPDKEAKPISKEKMTKDAGRMLNRAFKDSHKKKDVAEGKSLQDYIEAGVCPICHGDMVSEEQLAEGKKDACYHKIKASSKVWPSAYASGRLVQCRKAGAANYGKGKKK